MGTRYPGRPETSSKGRIISIRLDRYQGGQITEFASKFNMSISNIMREALAVWLNLNSKGGEK